MSLADALAWMAGTRAARAIPAWALACCTLATASAKSKLAASTESTTVLSTGSRKVVHHSCAS